MGSEDLTICLVFLMNTVFIGTGSGTSSGGSLVATTDNFPNC